MSSKKKLQDYSDKIVNFNEKYYYFVVDDFTNNKENTPALPEDLKSLKLAP